jgi:outer membrane protein TolC
MLAAKSRMAKLGAEVEGADVCSMRNSIARAIKHYYYEYSYWTFAENLIDDNIHLNEQIIDYIEKRYGTGAGSMEEVLSARVAKNELENEKLDVQFEKRGALYMLKQLVNDTSSFDTTLLPFLSFRLDEIGDSIPNYSNNPGLGGAATKYEVARAKHSLAKSEYWPEFMIGADYLIRQFDSSQLNSTHIAFPGEDMWSFHFGFTLPLWFFSKQSKMTKAAKYEMESAKANERAVDIGLRQSIREAQVKLRTLKERTNHFVEAIIPLTESAYDAAYVAYEVGQVDFQKLLEDQMALYMSKLEHLKQVKEFHQTKAYLDELTGSVYVQSESANTEKR